MNSVLYRATAILLAGGLLVLSGCNTWAGLGRDLEFAGEEMQQMAE
jgi:predicted small secreted protein